MIFIAVSVLSTRQIVYIVKCYFMLKWNAKKAIVCGACVFVRHFVFIYLSLFRSLSRRFGRKWDTELRVGMSKSVCAAYTNVIYAHSVSQRRWMSRQQIFFLQTFICSAVGGKRNKEQARCEEEGKRKERKLATETKKGKTRRKMLRHHRPIFIRGATSVH